MFKRKDKIVTIGASATREFVIENTGTGILTLSGTPPVRLTETNTDDFEVVSQPSTTVQPGDAIPFTVRFTPSATGTRSATVVITNNDADEGSFQFTIAGVGAASARR